MSEPEQRTPKHARLEEMRAKAPVDASMSLINDVLWRPLEAGYVQAAERKRADPNWHRPWWSKALLLALAIALGAGTVWGVRAIRAPLPEELKARQSLEQQLRDRSAQVKAQQAENEKLDAEVEKLQATKLALVDPALENPDNAVRAGTARVRGPGLEIVLDDAPAVRDDPDQANSDQRVQDQDLQVLANGLWAAGAEAVAINGQRLTALSAIRSAGDAILVDLSPLSPPYTVLAIGDPDQLETKLTQSAAGRRLATLRDNYDISVAIKQKKKLELGGVAVPSLRFASAAN